MKVDISQTAILPTPYGDFKLTAFREWTQNIHGRDCELEHLVISSMQIPAKPLVRIHSECLTGDVLHSLKCDCGGELEIALRLIQERGGMILYLRQEGRGIGLFNKINAYALQDQGMDTVEANEALGLPKDGRDYKIVEVIFKHFNLTEITLLTNNPLKLKFLKSFVSVDREEILAPSNCHNQKYLEIKKIKMGHLLP
ncbi:GTP cyclohydrolase II [Helicobacter pametensis]|uniref:GTP cyclohydrolase II n=1 Tax=Helicobacter pametensis TaxID=95149 RepID=UPI000486CDBB|nr:GTP cyclohydrolase II [Helicobacter pametensis]